MPPEQRAAAEAVLKEARTGVPPAGRWEQSTAELGGVTLSTLTGGVLALVLVACVISSLLVPGGLVSRQSGLAAVTRSGKEITRLRSLSRTVVAGSPAIVWLTYLVFSAKVQGFVPVPSHPMTGTLVTLGVLAIGHAWTVARRTRGPHDALAGTWIVPR